MQHKVTSKITDTCDEKIPYESVLINYCEQIIIDNVVSHNERWVFF